MAYLSQNQNLKPEDDEQQAGGVQAQGQNSMLGGTSPLANQGGGTLGENAGTGGAPQGGKAWTNIQAYLNANAGNHASTDNFNQAVTSAFDTEKNNLHTQADKAKSDATSQVEQNKLGTDKASQLIQQATDAQRQLRIPQETAQPPGGKPVVGSGAQSPGKLSGQMGSAPVAPTGGKTGLDPADIQRQYDDSIQQIRKEQTAQYGGPTAFNYGLGANTQEYGTNLGSDQGFKAIMNGLYNKAAGGQMGTGQLALQRQLDSNDETLNSARQAAAGKYQGLTSDVDNTVRGTNDALTAAKNQFGSDQAGVKSYLDQKHQGTLSELDQATAAWNKDALARQNSPLTASDFSHVYNPDLKGNVDLSSYYTDPRAAGKWNDPSVFGWNGYTAANRENFSGGDDLRDDYNVVSDALGSPEDRISHIGSEALGERQGNAQQIQANWNRIMAAMGQDPYGNV